MFRLGAETGVTHARNTEGLLAPEPWKIGEGPGAHVTPSAYQRASDTSGVDFRLQN